MAVSREADLKLSLNEIRTLRESLARIFPDVSPVGKDFVMRLTPGDLKLAYMRRASTCDPRTAKGLSRGEMQALQLRHQALTKAYKSALPVVNTIHQRALKAASRRHGAHNEGEATDRVILAVGGAKGGVGKSVLSANLAVGLALLGQRVVLADLDLGGADVHLYVGVKSLSKTWNDFLGKKVETIGDILTTTPFEGLSLIGGDASRLGSGNLPYAQKRQIIQHLKSLECDFIIIDLGGDTSFNSLDFFLLADQKIVVSGTEPASILDSYSFIKVVFHRFLERFLAEYDALQDLRRRVGRGELGKPGGLTLESVFKETRERDPTAHIKLKEQFEKFCLSIIVNMAEDRGDWRIAKSMQRIVKERCMVDVGILGTVPWDRAVRKAARAFTPIIIQDARNQSSQAIYRMLAAILLLREPKAIRSELLRKTNTIRNDTKNSIGAGAMTLDGLTATQINAVYGKSRKTQHGFRKILSAMAGSQ